MPIFKTTVTMTVMGEFDSLEQAQNAFSNTDPAQIAEECNSGDLIGQSHVGEVVEVTDAELVADLVALGNDGSFFGERPKAEVHSDDRVFEVDFDPTPWLRGASLDEIVALAECGWGGDYPADAVAQHVADTNPAVNNVLDYCTRKRDMGFEVHVDEATALEWLAVHRPDVADAIDALDEDGVKI